MLGLVGHYCFSVNSRCRSKAWAIHTNKKKKTLFNNRTTTTQHNHTNKQRTQHKHIWIIKTLTPVIFTIKSKSLHFSPFPKCCFFIMETQYLRWYNNIFANQHVFFCWLLMFDVSLNYRWDTQTFDHERTATVRMAGSRVWTSHASRYWVVVIAKSTVQTTNPTRRVAVCLKSFKLLTIPIQIYHENSWLACMLQHALHEKCLGLILLINQSVLEFIASVADYFRGIYLLDTPLRIRNACRFNEEIWKCRTNNKNLKNHNAENAVKQRQKATEHSRLRFLLICVFIFPTFRHSVEQLS